MQFFALAQQRLGASVAPFWASAVVVKKERKNYI